MTRFTSEVAVPPLEDVYLELLVPPADRQLCSRDRADERLEAAWWAYRDQIMDEHGGSGRPYGWWLFEAREAPPRDHAERTARLAELGER